jgi:ribosomal protein S18 acetylase RimI-like enzyme
MAIYFITPERLAALPEQTAEEWDGRFADRFVALHDQLFPRSNYTLNYMLTERDKGATLLILTDGDTPAGYFFGRAEPESGEAYVDLVGVDPAFHGRGLGRRLMLAGLSRLRAMPNLHQVNLTVEAGNLPAMRLYESLGFARERGMAAFRKKVQED